MKRQRLHLIRESDNLSGFSKSSWLTESHRLLRSALFLRAIRRRRKGRISRETNHRKRVKHIEAMDACVLSSNLLVAYAVEVALKAGLTAVYARCSQDLFRREVRTQYGHKFVKLAEEIDFPVDVAVRSRLEELKRIVLADGRYPPFARTKKESIDLYNKRAALLWSDAGFDDRVALCNAILIHVKRIDADSRNPVSWTGYRIDADGYVAFRCGGNLRPRITVRYSSEQRRLRQDNKRSLRKLLGEDVSVKLHWSQAEFRPVDF